MVALGLYPLAGAELGGEVTTHHDPINHERDAAYVLRSDVARQESLAAHYAEELQSLDDEDALDALGDASAFTGVSQYPARIKCALLGWAALKDSLARSGALS